MSSFDITMTGAAGTAPTPAAAVCPSLGTGLPTAAAVRGVASIAHRTTTTTSSTPGDLPPGEPLS